MPLLKTFCDFNLRVKVNEQYQPFGIFYLETLKSRNITFRDFILIREGVYLKKGRGVFIWSEYNVKSKWKPRTITKPNLVKGRNYVKS